MMERILCRRCLMLKKSVPLLSQRSSIHIRSTLPALPAIFHNKSHVLYAKSSINSVRFYAKEAPPPGMVYKYGKLIVEEKETPTQYDHFLMIFTSTDEAVLEGFVQFVRKAGKMTDVNVRKIFSMPATEEIYRAKRGGSGILTESQYKLINYQRVVELSDLSTDKSDIFLEYIQQNLPAGVNFEVQLKEWERYVEPDHVLFRDRKD